LFAWEAGFGTGLVADNDKPGDLYVRAVRTGSCD
jgi:hypothetical protein